MEVLDAYHQCAWRDKVEELSKRIEQLERMLFGKRSEKMPPVSKELKRPADHESIQNTRKERRAGRLELPEIRYEHYVQTMREAVPNVA